MDFDLPVARVYFPDRTFTAVVVRSRGGHVEVMAPKSLEVLLEFNATAAVYLCGRNVCEDPNVYARWALTLTDGSKALAEYVSGCGCGGWALGDAEPIKVAMA